MEQLCCVFQLAAVLPDRRTLTTGLSTALATSYVALVSSLFKGVRFASWKALTFETDRVREQDAPAHSPFAFETNSGSIWLSSR